MLLDLLLLTESSSLGMIIFTWSCHKIFASFFILKNDIFENEKISKFMLFHFCQILELATTSKYFFTLFSDCQTFHGAIKIGLYLRPLTVFVELAHRQQSDCKIVQLWVGVSCLKRCFCTIFSFFKNGPSPASLF